MGAAGFPAANAQGVRPLPQPPDTKTDEKLRF